MADKIKNLAVVVLASLFVGGFALWSLLQPDAATSVAERRPLAQMPEISAESVLSGAFMTDFERYTLDQFPLRDTFRTVKACTALYAMGQKDNNGLYTVDGYVSKLDYPLDTSSVDYALGRFQFVYDRYLAEADVNVYFSVIPDKNTFMAAENGYPAFDYAELCDRARSGTSFAQFIDIAPLLELSDYYRTDTHWRQESITDVAAYLLTAMGAEADAPDYTVQEADTPFYGTYAGQAALPLQPDALRYLESDTLARCTVYDHETASEIPVYALEAAAGKDPYALFLSGSKSLLTIRNPDAKTDRRLILFRDSFGSSLAPLLVSGYSEITLVDIRYISPVILDRFIDFEDQDVLFLYSASILNNSETIK